MTEKKDLIFSLAPMAGVTNKSFRQLIREINGDAVDLIFTEMINATGVSRLDNGTLRLLPDKDERCIVQIYGNNKPDLLRAAEYICVNYPEISGIDLNAACPVKKVTRNGSGSAMVHDFDNLENVITSLEQVVHAHDKMISVKIRRGWEGYENYTDIINLCDKTGIDFVSVHGRTVEQCYSGEADLSILENIKRPERIKIFWTGDVFEVEQIGELLKYEDVLDGILFARGTFGNPWLIRDARDFIAGREIVPVSFEEKKGIILRHAELLLQEYNEHKVIGQFKRFIAGYTKGMRNAKEKRNRIYRQNKLQDMIDLLILTLSADYESNHSDVN
jgi:nifR3 family TIM-barrel protein